MYITYKVYQMERIAPKSLSSLSLGPERKCKCYNGYFINGYVSILKNTGKEKTKPRGRVEIVQNENEDTSVQDEVFQVSELVEPYRVAPSIELEENSNFHVFNDSLVDVDAEELNVVLSSSGQANVDEEDDIHIEDCDEGDDNSIDDKEEENSD
jgi:hypothetical protein